MNELGYMLDCSRGAVARVSTIKRLIDCLSDWGYQYLMLYTEDTYEIKEEPYFGYMRGRYSEEEIKEIDSYAKEHNMELRPCIETLAHLSRLQANDQFDKYFDASDILLVRSEDTYHLIEEMFQSVSRSFSSRHIHIGMDEAFLLGRGRYIDKNGYEKKDSIIKYHLSRVSKIAKKYGFVCDIWADMLLESYKEDKENYDLKLPDNITPMIWRYTPWMSEKETIEEIKNYQNISNRPLSYAGGIIKWMGYVPANRYSLSIIKEQMSASKKLGINSFLVTGWGDGAAETSPLATLPGMFGASLIWHDKELNEENKKKFFDSVGMSYDDFLKVDSLSYLDKKEMGENDWNNLSFLHLYNDPLQNQLLEVELDKYPSLYDKVIKEMEPLISDPNFGYLFKTLVYLGKIDALTSNLGKETLNAYTNHESLKPMITKAKEALKAIDDFIIVFEEQWNIENKSFGLEKQEIRLGGLRERYAYFIRVTTLYEEKKIEKIDEYEENHLPKIVYGKKVNPDRFSANFYRYLVSAGILNDC